MKQEHWVKAKKNLLESVKSRVQAHLGSDSRSLKLYSRPLEMEFERPWDKSDFEELRMAARNSEMLFLGDFHAYYQSQRAHLRLLKEMDLSQSIFFAECFRESDSKWIDRFWEDRISEAEFLKKTRWMKIWGFPWEHYRTLFLYLKEHGVLVRGLSSDDFHDSRLKARDKKMAAVLVEEMGGNFDKKQVIVMAGEKHLFQNHLPLEVSRRLEGYSDQIIVFQDNENLYFRSALKGPLAESAVVRRKNSFCWSVSPPWVKWQSYLIYLEKAFDQELEDGVDYEDHIKAFVQWMGEDLGLEVSLNPLEVITSESHRRFKTKISEAVFRELVSLERSFLFDPKGKIYLARPSVNHAASAAGQYIHSQLSGQSRAFYNFPGDLERRLWVETVGFFFSKWMNPARKAGSFAELKIRLDVMGSKRDAGKTMKMISEVFVFSQRVGGKRSTLKKRPKWNFNRSTSLEASRFLGRIWGKALFDAVLSGRISKQEFKEWLQLSLEDKNFPKTFWENIVPRLI